MKIMDIKEYGIDNDRGFLPSKNPLTKLSKKYDNLENIAELLPKLLVLGKVRSYLQANLSMVDIHSMQDDMELNRAMLLFSYLGHAYVWGDAAVSDQLPANIAVPWHAAAKLLGRPPVLSYASHALYNWSLLDPNAAINLDNIIRLENFYGGIDEDWFVLIHIAIEAQAVPAIKSIVKVQQAVSQANIALLTASLKNISDTLEKMVNILARMPEKCDPYVYYQRVRPFIFGWMNNPSLPNGVYYNEVTEWHGCPQKFRGETGAQSSIIPSLDAGLGIKFDKENPFYKHLLGLRGYMPPKHRAFIEDLEENSKSVDVRNFIIRHAQSSTDLVKYYNLCMDFNYKFRAMHLDYAKNYINKQVEKTSSPVNTGTGGTPFIKYLEQHCQDILSHKIVVENLVSISEA